MRNLKKVLALVLALAMALSVMASAFTAPELSEEAQAEYDAMTAAQQNAFYVASALGLVKGYTDGTYRPEGTLTRAEFATMVYRAKTGDTEGTGSLFASADVSMFKDSIDTWAVPYIAYAYSAGIIAGYVDGTVRAANPVKGLEAAKMLLTALGYDAEIEGLVGPTYYANTIKLGSAVGLFNGVKGDLYAEITRADAFVMFVNALSASTVSYVGGVATPKTETLNSEDVITLGEEGFDLLDVEAILVATEDVALGAYWRNIIANGNAYGMTYEKYDVAPAGYARFVYRDYVSTNAANAGATYTDRVITVALGDQVAKFAELGEKYRLLVTDLSPVYNENEFRVLYGYPVAAANDGYYKVTTGEVNGLAASVIEKMEARANGVEKDYTVFVNGSAVTFEAAKAYAGKASTAPYKAVDNDNDGVVDALFIYDYTIGTVSAIDGNNVTVVGAGLGKIELANAAELAVGDYVAVYSDTDGKYAKKLEVKETNVTGYNADGYTIGGEKKTAGAYMSDSSKSLLGSETAAITDTVYKFVFDGSYIVNVEFTENTRYAKYALVDFIHDDSTATSYLGYPMVRLYTEDNEYVMAYVKTVDGYQVYDYQHFVGLNESLVTGELVTYELDGDYVYINTVASKATFEGNTVSTAYDFTYNRATDTWVGTTTNSQIAMKDTFGVVFVTYDGDDAQGAIGEHYRAYYNGEFQPNFYNAIEANIADGNEDLVVYVAQNGVNYIKAAVISFNHPNLDLPGLPTTRANDNFSIIKNSYVEKTAEGYVYTYTVYEPWSTSTKTLTSVPFAFQQNQPASDTIYNLTTNSDGKVTAWVALNAEGYENVLTDTLYATTNGIDMYGYLVTGFNMDVYGNIILTVSDLLNSVNLGFRPNNSEQVVPATTFTLNISKDADVWFFEANKDGDLSAKDWMSYVNYDYNNAPSDKKFIAYIDMNATTQTANRLVLISGDWAVAAAPETVALDAKVSYNAATKTIRYTFGKDTFLSYTGIANETIILDADGNPYFEVTGVYPWSTEFCSNGKVVVTFENISGVWTTTAIKGVKSATLYSNSMADADVAGIQYTNLDATAGLSIKTAKDVRFEDIDAVYMYRTFNDRLDRLYDADKLVAYGDLDDVATKLTSNVADAKADADCKSYEGIYVVTTLDGETILVLVDTSVVPETANEYPYASVNETDNNVADDDGHSGQNDNADFTLNI